MDEFLAGFGKLLGTLQMGSIAEWTAGVIATVALLVTVITQRRQQTESFRAESLLLRVSYDLRMISGQPNTKHQIKLASNSDKHMRDVSIVAFDEKQTGLLYHRETRPLVLMPYREDMTYHLNPDHMVRVNVGDIEPGANVLIRFETAPETRPTFIVYYEDFRGRNWEYDTSLRRRGKARWRYRN